MLRYREICRTRNIQKEMETDDNEDDIGRNDVLAQF
jgi:hypothetical protein